MRPKLVLDPEAGSRITFEGVVFDRTEASPAIIVARNEGDGMLSLDRVALEGPSAEDFRVSSAPAVLSPGRRGEIWLRFEPRTAAPSDATLAIESNDPIRRRVEFALHGDVREPCAFFAAPARQRFLLGEIREVEIHNSSSYECLITRATVDTLVFDFVEPLHVPFVVPPGESYVLRIQHVGTPRSSGPPSRVLRIVESEGTEQDLILEGEPPLFGCLSASSRRIDFDRADAGSTVVRSVSVRNQCDRAAAVSSSYVTMGVNYFLVDSASFPREVPARSSITIPVTYRAFSETGDKGELVLNTNDVLNPRFTVELYGTASFPKAQVFPSTLDLGTVVFRSPETTDGRSSCSSGTRYVQVYSVGPADLVVDRIETDPAGDGVFEVTGVTIDGEPVADPRPPIVVPRDRGEMRIFVQFFPTRAVPSEHRAVLSIHHNASQSPARVELRGWAAPDGEVRDEFRQLEGPSVDILWVIDDSGSMHDEQARLIANLSQFVGYAASRRASYQMAVTTTDSRSPFAGIFRRCFPHPTIIGSGYADTATREQAFACMFDVGTSGQGLFEAGLGAAMRAIERVLDPADQNPATNPNHGFLRPEAKLAIVVLSDEDDQSSESNQVLRDYFRAAKGAHRPDRVAVHAIAGPISEPCETGPRQSAPGYRYKWMTDETGGIFFNICRPDWQPVLRELGLEVFTPQDEWDLSQAADPGSLRVTVDGVSVRSGAVDGFTYNPRGNSVKFHGAAVPAPGGEIVVDYSGVCRP